MKLVDNLGRVVRHSWLFRLNVLLAICSGGDAALTYFADGRLGMSLVVFGWTAFSALALHCAGCGQRPGVLRRGRGMKFLAAFLALFTRKPAPAAAKPPVPTSRQATSTKGKTTAKGVAAIVGAGAAAILMADVPRFEGTILRGYRDPVGIVKVCTGHTKTAVLGRPYTKAECDKLLDEDLAVHAAGTMRCIKVPTSVGERAAYVSFAFNVGTGAFCKSTMLRKLNAGDRRGACDELSRWTKAKGRELPGLVTRRKAERAMCLQDL